MIIGPKEKMRPRGRWLRLTLREGRGRQRTPRSSEPCISWAERCFNRAVAGPMPVRWLR